MLSIAIRYIAIYCNVFLFFQPQIMQFLYCHAKYCGTMLYKFFPSPLPSDLSGYHCLKAHRPDTHKHDMVLKTHTLTWICCRWLWLKFSDEGSDTPADTAVAWVRTPVPSMVSGRWEGLEEEVVVGT